MTNLGYDEQHGHHSPSHDYDLPLSVENVSAIIKIFVKIHVVLQNRYVNCVNK